MGDSPLEEYLYSVGFTSPSAFRALIGPNVSDTRAISVIQHVLGEREELEMGDVPNILAGLRMSPEELTDVYGEEYASRGSQRGRGVGAQELGQTGIEGIAPEDPEANVGLSFRTTPRNALPMPPSYQELGAFTTGEWRGAVYDDARTREINRGKKQDDWVSQFSISQERAATNFVTGQPMGAQERYQQILFSMAIPRPDYSFSTGAMAGGSETITPFARQNAAGLSQMPRSVLTGQFVKMRDFLPTESEIQEILRELALWLREQFVKRYDALPIGKMGHKSDGSGSGTLKRAVKEMEIDIERDRGEQHKITLSLPDIERPARHGLDEPKSVRVYGPLVFQGRRGIVGRKDAPLRFQVRDEWISARNVMPSRKDLNVLEMTTELRQQMAREYLRLLELKIRARKTGARSRLRGGTD